MPIDDGSRKWTRVIWWLFAIIVALAVFIGGLWVALNRASDALAHSDQANRNAVSAAAAAQHAVDCINNVLGQRGPTSLRVSNAQLAYARADRAYNLAEKQFLSNLGAGSQSTFPMFIHALTEKLHASGELFAALEAQHRVQVAHPLGLC